MTRKDYAFQLPMRVRDYEVDCQGIVNNANYLHYMEHTRHEFCRAAGYSFAEMHLKGIDPVLRSVTIEYRQPLGLGQEFLSCINIRREGAKFIFDQDIYALPALNWPRQQALQSYAPKTDASLAAKFLPKPSPHISADTVNNQPE